jgi:hypothetical protein
MISFLYVGQSSNNKKGLATACSVAGLSTKTTATTPLHIEDTNQLFHTGECLCECLLNGFILFVQCFPEKLMIDFVNSPLLLCVQKYILLNHMIIH